MVKMGQRTRRWQEAVPSPAAGQAGKFPDTWELLLVQLYRHSKSRLQVLVNLYLLGRSQEKWVLFPRGPAGVIILPDAGEGGGSGQLAGKVPEGSRSKGSFVPFLWHLGQTCSQETICGRLGGSVS